MRRRARLRRFWLTIHRWLGRGAGLLVVLMGLTGSVLVFDHALDEWLNPELLLTANTGARIGPDRAAAAAIATTPRGYHLSWLSAPRTARGVYRAYVGPRGDGFWRMYGIDPVTGAITGSRPLSGHVTGTIHDLHFQLLLGPVGETVVGFIGLFALISLCTGVYLWWPRQRHLQLAFTIKRNAAHARRQFDLHRTGAIYTLPVIATLVITGIFMAWTHWLEPVVDRISPLTDPGATVHADRGDVRERVGS